MKKVFILVFLFSVDRSFAQTDSGVVVVHKDPRVDLLIKKQIQINDITTRDSRRNVAGFRILVISSNDRNKVFSAKAKIYQQYPELKPYILYLPPNYKLKVGNFKTQEEAQPYFDRLLKLYPTGVYIIHDMIEVKPEKATDN
ncbi:MAG: SPOR domain-containing protein [Bacteroidetes bacterium]|nr:SPOR domain-containing protein [Bacteroidota bacterium]